MNELIRVAAPGGRIIIVTWCHRDLAPGEAALQPDELVSRHVSRGIPSRVRADRSSKLARVQRDSGSASICEADAIEDELVSRLVYREFSFRGFYF